MDGTLWLECGRGKSRLPEIHTPEVWTSQSSLRPSITIAASGYRRCLNPGFLERAQYQADYPTERRTLRASKYMFQRQGSRGLVLPGHRALMVNRHSLERYGSRVRDRSEVLAGAYLGPSKAKQQATHHSERAQSRRSCGRQKATVRKNSIINARVSKESQIYWVRCC